MLTILAVVARFGIRIFVQKSFSVDDGFVVFGTGCLVTAFVVLLHELDTEYMIEAYVFNVPGLELSPDFFDKAISIQKTTAIIITLSWCAVASVKFSFLFLFRKLISRVRSLLVFWWVTVIVNLAVFGFGLSVYFIACQGLFTIEAGMGMPSFVCWSELTGSVKCASGEWEKRTVRLAVTHMALDVFTDLLSTSAIITKKKHSAAHAPQFSTFPSASSGKSKSKPSKRSSSPSPSASPSS